MAHDNLREGSEEQSRPFYTSKEHSTTKTECEINDGS